MPRVPVRATEGIRQTSEDFYGRLLERKVFFSEAFNGTMENVDEEILSIAFLNDDTVTGMSDGTLLLWKAQRSNTRCIKVC